MNTKTINEINEINIIIGKLICDISKLMAFKDTSKRCILFNAVNI